MAHPGYGTTVSNDPEAILESGHGWITKRITVKLGEGALAKGTVLAYNTSTGKYVAYDDTGSYGANVAMGILADKIDTTSSDQLANMYIRGAFVVGKLTGYDAAALTDLNGRRIGSGAADTDTILI